MSLMQAIDNGDPTELQVLLKNTKPSKVDLATALLESVRKGDNACVLVLLESGQVGPGVFRTLPTLLVDAATTGHTDIAKMLLDRRVPVDQVCTLSKKSALHEAARLGNLELCKMLVEAGVPVNAEDNTWVTPVMHAASENHVDIVRFLVKHGSMVSLRDKNGESALSKAVDKGHLPSTEALLQMGADCNIRTQGKFSNTLIHIAAKRDNPQVLRLLLHHNAKYEGLCNMLGQTPFDISLLFGCKECIDQFLEWGADTNRVHHDWTPLMRAASRGLPSVIKSLLRHGADPCTSNMREKTALHKAIDAQCVDAVQILVEAGADINASPREGLTPLHLAALQVPIESTFDIILVLLRGGADMNAVNRAGQHASHLALSDFYFPTVRMLFQAGSQPRDIGILIKDCLDHLETLVNFLCGNDFLGEMVYHADMIEHNVRYMYEATHNPRSLQNHCCIFIRKTLKTNIHQKTLLLPLPTDLKNKVNFQDVEDLREYFNAIHK